jgi:alpha-glucuronidase
MRRLLSGLFLSTLLLAIPVSAETGYGAWLRYARIEDDIIRRRYAALPASVFALGDSALIQAAQQELVLGIQGMLGRTLRAKVDPTNQSTIILGTLASVKAAEPTLRLAGNPGGDGYLLKRVMLKGHPSILITGPNDRGVLYGVFVLLRKIGLGESVTELDEQQAPYAALRMLDQWDNLDGTIERGYAGPSIFFEKNNVVTDLSRVHDYARLMASIGINACSINNVNANPRVITTEFIPQLARVADVFRNWGVRLFVSIDFSSPQKIGGLVTFDPLDQRVAEWWKKKADEIYYLIPDFGGFVLKADSEGRLGPSAYGRSHADAGNMIGRALKPYGGLILYRGFVYDHQLDWRNLKNDRARAAYDNLQPLDGRFDNNVVVQIKHGPIDFQVREPASPLLGALERTNQVIELQITQEYTGQQRHLCFLVPMWKEVLDFDMHAKGAGTPVKDLVAGRTFNRPVGGLVGVCNVGRDQSWLGLLAMANLYGFGRLAWNPNLTSLQIAEEWTRLSFNNDSQVVKTITRIQLSSWPTYEKYTGPLGAGTLTDIINIHYGPAVESSERNGWGQWHRADESGIGMDRTLATGTGYTGQYRQPVAKMYESVETCPDELLLFMHHLPYTHVLHSGKTIIQHIYDTHYEGAEEANQFVAQWELLKGRVDMQRYQEVLNRLEYQAGHAQVWRDAVCNWFLRTSGIPDVKNRAGNFPGRVEAEAMKLDGYQIEEVRPWEAASGSKAIKCLSSRQQCSASFRYVGKPGRYDVGIQYFDLNNGASHFKLFIASKLVAEWVADDVLPTSKMDAHSSTRRRIRNLALYPRDEIRIEGVPNGGEGAPIDYIEILSSKR